MKFIASLEDYADTPHIFVDRPGDRQTYRIILNFFGSRFGHVKSALRSSAMVALLGVGVVSAMSSVSIADESGTSFWLPGTYGSLAAVPGTPGWAVASVYYHTTLSAGADVAAAR
jgi:hypothetical protein